MVFAMYLGLQTLRINFNTSNSVSWHGHGHDCPCPVEGAWLYIASPQGSHPRPAPYIRSRLCSFYLLSPQQTFTQRSSFCPLPALFEWDESLGLFPLFLTLALTLDGVLSFLFPLAWQVKARPTALPALLHFLPAISSRPRNLRSLA